jgi:hypothetical protein
MLLKLMESIRSPEVICLGMSELDPLRTSIPRRHCRVFSNLILTLIRLITALAVTVPASFYLLSSSPAGHDSHGSDHGHSDAEHKDDHKDEKPHEEPKEEKSDDSSSEDEGKDTPESSDEESESKGEETKEVEKADEGDKDAGKEKSTVKKQKTPVKTGPEGEEKDGANK